MKKTLSIITLLIVSGISLFANGSREQDSNIIVVGTEGTYKPFTFHNNEGTLTGFDVDVIKAVVENAGYEIKFEESRWDGLLAGLKSNRWDVVANQVWWNESRDQEYLLSDPYLVAGASILVRDDNTAQNSSELAGQTAAVSLTSAYRPIVEELTSEVEFQDDFILAVDLLRTGRVDFVVNDSLAIGEYLIDNPDSNLVVLPLENADTYNVVFALSKDNPDLLAEINASLTTLKNDGSLRKITQKYFGEL